MALARRRPLVIVRFRMIDLQDGGVQDIELHDPAVDDDAPKMPLVIESLKYEGKVDPLFFCFGPPGRPWEPRPVAVLIFDDEPEPDSKPESESGQDDA